MIDLSTYKHSYRSGRSRVVCAIWFFIGLPLLRCQLLPFSWLRRGLLRLFGAEIGGGVVIKPGVRVKYPWLLRVGKHSWIGEDCWIDNLALVSVGNNVCISQGAHLCTGSHDWSDPSFSLIARPIYIHDGAWVCVKAIIAPGIVVGEGGVVAAGAVATKSIPPYKIYAGNPAEYRSERRLSTDSEAAIQAEAS